MSRTGEATLTKVASRDGTEIAYWTTGEGPPLVLVHGTTADHTRWGPLLPYMEPHATVHAMDRRGRGASGDSPEYDAGREFEDVAAVIDSVARASGAAVDVYGHSYGGLCAFNAATMTSNVRKLALYEGWPSVDPTMFTPAPGCWSGWTLSWQKETARALWQRSSEKLWRFVRSSWRRSALSPAGRVASLPQTRWLVRFEASSLELLTDGKQP